ncbi:MAG: hypothetical protein LC798_11265 [Chloroflexi bacterium]|nr:hypothetical protein [Chloroflexota bacterium]
MNQPLYNFRISAEAGWLIVNTILGALLIDVIGRLSGLEALPTLDTLGAWVGALGLSALRTGLGALLAAVTGGAFLKPGETPDQPTPG